MTLAMADKPGLPDPVPKTNYLALAKSGKVTGGVSITNTASTSSSIDGEEDGEDEKVPAPDLSLTEAEHILVDYFSLMPHKQSGLTAGRPAETQRN